MIKIVGIVPRAVHNKNIPACSGNTPYIIFELLVEIMLDNDTKRRIDTARDVLVGKVPDPKSQVEQITIALIYKFMDDMDKESVTMGGKPSFFVGEYEKYSWSKIFDPRLGGFEMLALYADAITRMSMNPNLPQLFRDIFKNAYLPYRDPETLKLFLKTINEFNYDHSERLGDAFEYLLSVLGSQGEAGQFRTPRHIIDFIVSVIQPKKNETILDPACGTAGFLISSYKHIMKDNTKKTPGDLLTPEERRNLLANFKGYDISPDMVRLSVVNLYLHGFVQPQILEYDTLTSEDRWNEYADVLLANPPFMSPKGGIKPHKRFSVQSNRSEVLFVDYIAEHLRPTGRAGIIVPEGIIFQSANAYKQLRKYLVDNEYLWAVVSLPAGVFNPYSGVKTSILLMDRVISKKTDKILFVKVDNDGFDLGAQRRPNGKNDLPDATNFLVDWLKAIRNRETEHFNIEERHCDALLVEKAKLAENGDYNLTGDRYRQPILRTHQKWPMVKLGEVCEVISGQSPEGEFYNTKGEGTPFYQGKTEFSDKYLGNPVKWTTQETKIAGKNDILISVRAPVGPVNIATQRICIGRGLAAIRTGEKLLMPFLFAILRAKEKEIKGNSGSTFDSINRKDIQAIQIPLPPLDVQREIVAEIESYQKIIDGARQVVESWKPQIDIDPQWPMVKLGEVCEINPKKFEVSSVNMETLVSFLPMEDIGVEQNIFPKKEKQLGEVYKGYTYFRDNDVLIAKVTPCFENGKSGIARRLKNGLGFGSSELHVIRPSKKILPEYIYPFVSCRKFLIIGKTKMTGTGGLQRVPAFYISDFDVPLPPLDVQRETVARIEVERKVVDGCKELIALYEAKIKKVIDKVWEE